MISMTVLEQCRSPEPDDWRAKTIPPKELEGEDGRPSGQQIKDAAEHKCLEQAPGNSSDWTGRPPKDNTIYSSR